MTTQRQPRATQHQMVEREARVIELLGNGPMTVSQLFKGSDLTYSQAVLLLRRMESQEKIFKLGKEGKNVIYALSGKSAKAEVPGPTHINIDRIPFDTIINQIHQGNNNVKIVGLNLTPDHLLIDLEFPTGEKMNAELVALGSSVDRSNGEAA